MAIWDLNAKKPTDEVQSDFDQGNGGLKKSKKSQGVWDLNTGQPIGKLQELFDKENTPKSQTQSEKLTEKRTERMRSRHGSRMSQEVLPELATDMSPEQLAEAEKRRAAEIPEISEVGIKSVAPEANLADSMAALSTTDSAIRPKDEEGAFVPSELSKILKQADPSIQIVYTPEGVERAYNPETQQIAELNKPGLSQKDVMTTLGLSAAFSPAGKGVLTAATGAAKVGAGLAGSGVTQFGIEEFQKSRGGESDPSEIATATVAGGMIPAVAIAGKPAIKKISSMLGNKADDKILEAISNLPDANAIERNIANAIDLKKTSKSVSNRIRLATKRKIDNTVAHAIVGANDADKKVLRRVIVQADAERLGKAFEATRNHVKPLGDTVFERWSKIATINRSAGKRLESIAASDLKNKVVDIAPIKKSFNEALRTLGVRVDDADQLVFESASIAEIPAARDMVRKAWNLVRGSENNAVLLHRSKQILSELVNFESPTGGIGGKTQTAIKGLRKDINNSLRKLSSKYGDVNDEFSDTIDLMNEFKKATGGFFDPKDKKSKEILGYFIRGINKNDPTSVGFKNVLEKMEKTAARYNQTFDTDIGTQVLFNDELERVLKISYKPLAEELAGKAPLEASRAVRGPGGAASSAADILTVFARSAIRGGKPDEKAFNALKRLIE